MANEWQRVAATTIKDYVRGYEEMVLRRRILLDRLRKAGNIEYNCSGTDYQWNAKKSQRPLQVNNGTQVLTFAPTNVFKNASLTWQGYVMADAMSKREYLENRFTPALIKVWDTMSKDMMSDLESRFSDELHIDSAATGNSGRISGSETLYGSVTQTINSTSSTATAARTANAADMVGFPAGSYAGLSTALGNEGGSWTGRWPEIGSGDAEYDYWSPLVVNYSSTGFATGDTTWTSNCVAAVRFALTFSHRNIAAEGQGDLVLLTSNMFRQYKDKLDPKERVIVNQGNGKDREYGIKQEVLYQDGAEITHEFGVPSAVGYLYNIEQMHLLSLQEKLFDPEGPLYDISSRSWRMATDFLGQNQFVGPRSFGKLMTLA